jgi:hypothetical protein
MGKNKQPVCLGAFFATRVTAERGVHSFHDCLTGLEFKTLPGPVYGLMCLYVGDWFSPLAFQFEVWRVSEDGNKCTFMGKPSNEVTAKNPTAWMMLDLSRALVFDPGEHSVVVKVNGEFFVERRLGVRLKS